MFWKKKPLWNDEDPQFRYYFGEQEFQKNHLLAHQLHWSINRHQAKHNGHVFMLSGAHDAKHWMYSNILQANSNYLIPDFGGEIYEDTHAYLESQGYMVHVLNLCDATKSLCYNPLLCMKQNPYPHAADVHNLVGTLLHESTYPDDPFFRKAGEALITAILHYMRDLHAEQCTMETVISLLPKAVTRNTKWDGGVMASSSNPYVQQSLTVVKQAAGMILNQAALCAAETLRLLYPLMHDAPVLDMSAMTSGKHAVYIIAGNPQWHKSAIAMLYTQLMDVLYAAAEASETHQLETTWLCFVDQWHWDMAKRLATSPKYNIRFVLRYHDMAVLKHEYPQEWECVYANCDALIYMNSTGRCDYEWVIQMLSKTLQISDKEDCVQVARQAFDAITPEECIIFTRGKTPFCLKKLDWTRHPKAGEIPTR